MSYLRARSGLYWPPLPRFFYVRKSAMKILIKALAKYPAANGKFVSTGKPSTSAVRPRPAPSPTRYKPDPGAPSLPSQPATFRWLSRTSDLRLSPPCPLQALGRHGNGHRQHTAEADDHGHWHRRAVVQHADQRRRACRHTELNATEQRRRAAWPARPARSWHRPRYSAKTAQAGDADKQRHQQRP